MLRLLMVDDHLMLTEALGSRLQQATDLWVVGRCATGDPHLAAMVDRLRPDVITVDVDPVASTGELVEAMLQALPSVAVVVLTGGLDPQRAVEAARAGATGWVPKESGVEELTAVLRGVCAGHACFPPEVLGVVLRALREDVRLAGRRDGPLDVLSVREREVLRGMVEGKRGARIARDLAISTETVRTHTRSILSKLRVHSQLEAVSVASAAGLRAGSSGREAGKAVRAGGARTDPGDTEGGRGAHAQVSTAGAARVGGEVIPGQAATQPVVGEEEIGADDPAPRPVDHHEAGPETR